MFVNEVKARVEHEIFRFCADRGRDDVLLFYLSGHGLMDQDGHLYFPTSDYMTDNLAATAVSADYVMQQLRRSRSQNVVLFLDCSFGGAFRADMKPGEQSGTGDFSGEGFVVISSASSTETSFEGPPEEPSNFTGAIVQGLRTGNADLDRDGWITVRELFRYVVDKMKGTSRQTPTITSVGSGDILIARNPASSATNRTPGNDAASASEPFAPAEPGQPGGVDDPGDENLALRCRAHRGERLLDCRRRTRLQNLCRRDRRIHTAPGHEAAPYDRD